MKMNGSNLNLFDYYWYENFSGVYEEKDPCRADTLHILWNNGKWEIPLYSAIFLLAVVGNILVILTLAKNSRMRTNTNVFLLNLAISDLVLAALCMPFTLIGTLLRDFVFGEWMCKLVPFLQATSVAASVWTLVALSVERYYAICHPLRSRRWQTLSHAYHLIGYIWTGGAVAMLPIAVLSELQPTNKGHHKCRERWPSGDYERAYNLFLDFLLLVVPLLALGVTYYLIAITLWRDLAKRPKEENRTGVQETFGSLRANFPGGNSRAGDGIVFVTNPDGFDGCSSTRGLGSFDHRTNSGEKKLFGRWKPERMNGSPKSGGISVIRNELPAGRSADGSANGAPHASGRLRSLRNGADVAAGLRGAPALTGLLPFTGLRHSNYERSLTKKQRVIKMLFVVVLEFFVCWTPLYVINTLALFWPHLVYGALGYKMISVCQLLAYTSGCCNPITYCFMNKGFRNSFINLFSCCKSK